MQSSSRGADGLVGNYYVLIGIACVTLGVYTRVQWSRYNYNLYVLPSMWPSGFPSYDHQEGFSIVGYSQKPVVRGKFTENEYSIAISWWSSAGIFRFLWNTRSPWAKEQGLWSKVHLSLVVLLLNTAQFAVCKHTYVHWRRDILRETKPSLVQYYPLCG